MRPKYNGIKFYDKNDWATGGELRKCESFIDSFDASKTYSNVNEVIELYNVQQLLESDILLKEWSEDYHRSLKLATTPFDKVIGKFYSTIQDCNFVDVVDDVAIEYFDDFWELFVKYKTYKKITAPVFEEYLLRPHTTLYKILQHKGLVFHYGETIARVLRVSNQTAEILINKHLKRHSYNCYIPTQFDTSEYESVFLEYIDSEAANPNYLYILYNSQSSKECPVSDDVRLAAKHAYRSFWEKHQGNMIKAGYGIGVSFTEQKEPRLVKLDGMDYHVSYDINWLKETLDYPSILNNFIFVFEMMDWFCRSNLVSLNAGIGAIENIFLPDGIKFYNKGNQFDMTAARSNIEISSYYYFLKDNGIDLENVFKWFFETYISEEFGITGFSFVASNPESSFAEKCKNLSSEMEGTLKQFRLYVRKGEINRELFEMSSEHIVVADIPSLIERKYAYSNSEDLNREMHMLFSDQSVLGCTEKTQTQYDTLFDLLSNEKMTLSDFYNYQQEEIEWLIDKGSLFKNGDVIVLDDKRTTILRDLYLHEVLCVYHLKAYATELKAMEINEEIIIKNSLFSNPEKEYLNYELNKSEYSNGLDLKNKYSHSTYPKNENEQAYDYFELLKIMVLVISKINDELCFCIESGNCVNLGENC